MKVKFLWEQGKLEFVDESPSINANDVMWQQLEVELVPPFTNPNQTLSVVFEKKDGTKHTHTILLNTDYEKGTLDIPSELLQNPGEWTMQLLAKIPHPTIESIYKTKGSNEGGFVVEKGLQVDEEGNPITVANLPLLLNSLKSAVNKAEEAKAKAEEFANNIEGHYIEDISITDDYGLRFELTNGETFETESVRGEQGVRDRDC